MGVTEDVAARIRNARLRRGLSQASVAKLAGLSRTHYGQLERGQSSPTVVTLEAVANALGESLPELLGERAS
ncbi:MAG: helix-turn-helix transcriptional regulator [Actinomycetota bacterium]|nr:helix-turn-helix transcriptional regulator [Actinomycetota bacterium]